MNFNFNVHHTPGNIEIAETMFDRNILEKYNCAFEFFTINNEYEKFIEEIFKNFKNIKFHKFKVTKTIMYYIYNDEFFISLNISKKSNDINMYTKDYSVLEKIYNLYKKYEKINDEAQINYSEINLTPQGISSARKTITINDLKDINEKYYPYINIELFMDEFIYGDENILILCGEPGTGKSKFASLIMKKLLEDPSYINHFDSEDDPSVLHQLDEILEQEKIYYIASTKNIDLLAKDEFWSKMKNQDVIIFDDLDFLLSSRKENREDVIKNQFLSNLLSFSDGIEKSKTKIIITTNQPFDTLDEALLREGRLFAILEFRGLNYDEAKDIWISEGLDADQFDKNDEIQEIFDHGELIKHSKLGSIIQNLKRNKKLIKKKDFILDESIDALRKAQKRRAGLI
jgi:DNA replication protein DnaC